MYFRFYFLGKRAEEMKATRKHQYRLRRSYQFPNARASIDGGEAGIYGWVVNVQGSPRLYGVVRYFVDGDTRAWVESDSHFGEDAQATEEWVRKTMEEIKEEQETWQSNSQS